MPGDAGTRRAPSGLIASTSSTVQPDAKVTVVHSTRNGRRSLRRVQTGESVTNTLILKRGAETYEQRDNVKYAELARRTRDGEFGVAIQYMDDETDFVVGARIAGVYPEEVTDHFTDEYDAHVNYGTFTTDE